MIPNKFRNLWCLFASRSWKKVCGKYLFARKISKLAQFTPFASTNIPSKRELLKISAEFLALYCTSILWYNDLEKQYFWHCTPAQISQHEAHNWYISDLKFPVEYQRTHLLSCWLISLSRPMIFWSMKISLEWGCWAVTKSVRTDHFWSVHGFSDLFDR